MQNLLKVKENEKSDIEKNTLIKGDDLLEGRPSSKGRLGWSNQKDKIGSTVSLEKAESYEEAFAKIEAATGIHDIDRLVQNFIQAEENNFALFKFVNDLSNEIEVLESQISEMQEELEKNRGQGQSTDNNRKKILKELEEKLSKTEMKAEQLGLDYG